MKENVLMLKYQHSLLLFLKINIQLFFKDFMIIQISQIRYFNYLKSPPVLIISNKLEARVGLKSVVSINPIKPGYIDTLPSCKSIVDLFLRWTRSVWIMVKINLTTTKNK